MTDRAKLADEIERLATLANGHKLPDGPVGDLLELLNPSMPTILAALREPSDEAIRAQALDDALHAVKNESCGACLAKGEWDGCINNLRAARDA